MKKKSMEPSMAARNAAERHEGKTGHATIDLWNDATTKVEGVCCLHCDWLRENRAKRENVAPT